MPLKPSASSPSASRNPKKKHKKTPNPIPDPSSSSSPNSLRPKLPPPSLPSMSKDGPESGRKRPHNQMDDEDAITILNAVVDFRANHGGSGPTPTTMKPVFDAVKDDLHQRITIDQLYNRFRSLKHRYSKMVESGVGPSSFDHMFFDLSVRAWGEKKPKDGGFETISVNNRKKSGIKKPKTEENGDGHGAAENCGGDDDDVDTAAAASADDTEGDDDDDGDDEENGEGSDSFKILIDQARKYWEKEGMSVATLELGLKYMDKSKAAALEKRWRQHLEAAWKIEAKALDVKKDFLTALSAVHKDASL